MSNSNEKIIKKLAGIEVEIKNINKLFDQLPCTLHTNFLTKLRVEDEKILSKLSVENEKIKGTVSKMKFNIYAAVISFIIVLFGLMFSVAKYFKI